MSGLLVHTKIGIAMDCLACRRLLLTSPRSHIVEAREHLATCAACSRFRTELDDLERRIDEAALVAVPDALVHRILLGNRRRPIWHYAAAATIVIVTGVSAMFAHMLDTGLPTPVEAVGPSHPAVAAISLVINDRQELERQGDVVEMRERLRQLGLALDSSHVHAYYAGKCQLPGAECDLIVLDAPDGRANVVLVPDYPILGQALVADRRMIALVSPAKQGGYIVVADTPKVAKRMQRLFRRG
jgi:hypothetical protein